jgi:putative transposase
MPNHLHGIVQLTTLADEEGGHIGPPLPRMVQWFKTMSTAAYLRGVKEDGWRSFPAWLWQRNYYERIIRSDKEFGAVRDYLAENPRNWLKDADYIA